MNVITFYTWNKLPSGKYFHSPIPSVKVADLLKIPWVKLVEAFQAYGDQIYPEMYYPVGMRESKDGSTFPVFIYIWEFQGLNSMNKNGHGWGWCEIVRRWGKGYRALGTHHQWYKEIVIDG